MGELSVSRTPGHVLASIGLGSCIALVLVEASRPLAGLAHIVLPSSGSGSDAAVGKFADRAVPALLEQMVSIGALRGNLQAVLVGGAQMFALGSSAVLDIGRRNERAAREELARAGLTVRAAATGGDKGRTVRVYVDSGRVTVKEPGATEVELFSGAAAAAWRRAEPPASTALPSRAAPSSRTAPRSSAARPSRAAEAELLSGAPGAGRAR